MPRRDINKDRISREPDGQPPVTPVVDPDGTDPNDSRAEEAMETAMRSIPVEEPAAEPEPGCCSFRGILYRLGAFCAPSEEPEEVEESDAENQIPSPSPKELRELEIRGKQDRCARHSEKINRVTALVASSLGLATLSGTSLTDPTLGALGFGLSLTMSGAIKLPANALLLGRSCELSRPCTHPFETTIGMGQGLLELFIGLMIVALDPVVSSELVTALMIVGSLLLLAEHAYDFVAHKDSSPAPSAG